jgi:hypothetical protein
VLQDQSLYVINS